MSDDQRKDRRLVGSRVTLTVVLLVVVVLWSTTQSLFANTAVTIARQKKAGDVDPAEFRVKVKADDGWDEDFDEAAAVQAVRYLRKYSAKLNFTSPVRRIKIPKRRAMAASLPTVVPPAPPRPQYSDAEQSELTWSYLMLEKDWPYVGSDAYIDRYASNSRPYFNSLAVFPMANRTRLHGLVGIWPNGTRWWQPKPTPPLISKHPELEDEVMKRGGGFNIDLSDSLPLDREAEDTRDAVCKSIVYNTTDLEDVSVIITFYNEPLSTLLRSVHSVLNRTPPPLLKEIILVDDHSNLDVNLPGGELYQYVRLLPKVKLLRLPERHGLVSARLAGAKVATAPVIVVLDSHIETNVGWLEPQLQRLRESPRSIVFPQIPSLDAVDFHYHSSSGIGCKLSFKWIMQEIPDYIRSFSTADAVSSASMAGGLFAVRRDWFFELGGYDEEFTMWGAENVEMAFRGWMCGGRVECVPCARAYHIYRHKGSGYKSPPGSVVRNRLRTSLLWTDEFYQLTKSLFGAEAEGIDLGPVDKVLELKHRLKCKNFRWFLENLAPNKTPATLDDVKVVGEIRSLGTFAAGPPMCFDCLQNSKSPGKPWGLYSCHNLGGSQAFLNYGDGKIHHTTYDNHCMGASFKFTNCDRPGDDDKWNFDLDTKTVRFAFGSEVKCLHVDRVSKNLSWKVCDVDDIQQKWKWAKLTFDPNYKPPKFSEDYIRKQNELASRGFGVWDEQQLKGLGDVELEIA